MKLIHNKYLGVPNIFINMTTASTKYQMVINSSNINKMEHLSL
jgi:hypothetical protein